MNKENRKRKDKCFLQAFLNSNVGIMILKLWYIREKSFWKAYFNDKKSLINWCGPRS